MDRIDERLASLESRIAEAEKQFGALREENERLRAKLDASPETPDPQNGGRPESSQLRLLVLETERREIRSRLRTVLESL